MNYKDIEKEFREEFDTQGKKTYIGDLLQYEDEEGNILFTIDDIKFFLKAKINQVIDDMIGEVDKNWDYPIKSLKQIIGVHPEVIEQEKKNALIKEIVSKLKEYKVKFNK